MDYPLPSKKLMKNDLGRVENHPDDPFKPYADEKLRELADSIAEFGLLEPICVRLADGGAYQILAGKNRTNAARLLGMETIEVFVFDADDETAVMIITDSNLKHRISRRRRPFVPKTRKPADRIQILLYRPYKFTGHRKKRADQTAF